MEVIPGGIPGSLQEYLPDPAEPIDRWFQMPNASNVRTTARILQFLALDRADALVDPFVGGGSTAMAARILGLPFFGIELDPVLACMSIIKSSLGHSGRHLLADSQARREPAGEPIHGVSDGTDHALLRSCADLLIGASQHSGTALSAAEMVADLASAPAPAGSRIIWGDCGMADAWNALDLTGRHVVLYTSPPFGEVSPRLQTSPSARKIAEYSLRSAGLATGATEMGRFPHYAEVTLAMFRQVVDRADRVTFVIEHEPADDGTDSRLALIDALGSEFGTHVRNLRVLECAAFSRRGPFSLIVGETHRG